MAPEWGITLANIAMIAVNGTEDNRNKVLGAAGMQRFTGEVGELKFGIPDAKAQHEPMQLCHLMRRPGRKA